MRMPAVGCSVVQCVAVCFSAWHHSECVISYVSGSCRCSTSCRISMWRSSGSLIDVRLSQIAWFTSRDVMRHVKCEWIMSLSIVILYIYGVLKKSSLRLPRTWRRAAAEGFASPRAHWIGPEAPGYVEGSLPSTKRFFFWLWKNLFVKKSSLALVWSSGRAATSG